MCLLEYSCNRWWSFCSNALPTFNWVVCYWWALRVLVCFQTESHYVPLAGLKFLILQPQPPECRDSRDTPPIPSECLQYVLHTSQWFENSLLSSMPYLFHSLKFLILVKHNFFFFHGLYFCCHVWEPCQTLAMKNSLSFLLKVLYLDHHFELIFVKGGA